jgi:hypothetical protein
VLITLRLDGITLGYAELAARSPAISLLVTNRAFHDSPIERTARQLGIAWRALLSDHVARLVAARAVVAAHRRLQAVSPRLSVATLEGADVAIRRCAVVTLPRAVDPLLIVWRDDALSPVYARQHIDPRRAGGARYAA